MAKSEIPNIVVQSGGGNNNSESRDGEFENHLNRSTDIKRNKEMEEASAVPSPVTIHIEDRDSIETNCVENGEIDSEIEDITNNCTDNKIQKNHTLKHGSQHKSLYRDERETKEKGQRFGSRSSRVKLLVRSQAIQDDTSPPPELDTVMANSNMLSVNNSPIYSQNQGRNSSKHGHLSKQGSSQSSTEGSPSLSRDSSTETYTDATGIDLRHFIIETLNKNQKDRMMLMKLEQEFITFIKENTRTSHKFPQMSSYNRMLVHRIAAFFGLEHNVDHSGTAIIVNKTKNTRIPDFKFGDYIRDDLVHDEPKKSILKRDNASFEDGREKMSEKQLLDSRRSKSFEEREEEYQKAKARIFKKEDQNFNQSEGIVILSHSQEEQSENESQIWMKNDDSSKYPVNNSLSAENETIETEGKVLNDALSNCQPKDSLHPNNATRPPMMKSHSFGGISVLISESSSTKGNNTITKAESFNTTVSTTTHSTADVPAKDHGNISPSQSVARNIVMPIAQDSEKIVNPPNSTNLSFIVGTSPQVSMQQLPSQTSEWMDSNKEECVTSVTVPALSNIQNDSIAPSAVITETSMGTSYIKVDETADKKQMANGISQTVMFTPFQQVLTPPVQVVASNQVTGGTTGGQIYQQQYIPAVVYIPFIPTQNQLMPQTPQQQNQDQRQNHMHENPSASVGDLINQVTNLTFNTQSPSSVSNLSTGSEDAASPPSQGFSVPMMKPQNIVGQQGNTLEPSFCYIQGTPNILPIQCLHPSSSGLIQGNNMSAGVNGSTVPQQNSGENSQTNVQSETNSPCLSNCNAILLPQTGNTVNMPFFSYSSALQPSVITSTSGLYQYPTIVVPSANRSNSSQVQQNNTPLLPPPPTQLSPAVSNTSTNLPSFMLTGTALSQHSTNIPNAPYNTFRPQTPPMQNIAVQSHQVTNPPAFNYALYQPLHAQPTNSLKPPNAVPNNQAFVRSFPTIRQNIPLVGNLPNNTPAVTPNRFPAPSLTSKTFSANKSSETRGKHGSNSNQNSQKNNRNPQLQLGNRVLPSTPNLGSMYCRGYRPTLPDIQFIGHPLQHTFNSLIMSQQQQGGSHHSHGRQSKSRRQRDKAANNAGNRGNSSNNNMQDLKAGNNVLQVEGLPEGMKRTEMERYLELVTNFGGKIQFFSADGKLCASNDFIVGPKYQVLAVFESSNTAQSALLNIKTNKFQLRPLCRKDKNSSSKKL